MNSLPNRRRVAQRFGASVLCAGVLAALIWFNLHRAARPQLQREGATTVSQRAQAEPSSATHGNGDTVHAALAGNPQSLSAGDTVPPVTDGKDLDSIRKWAHNETEVQRMVEENSRIQRRQLVYRQDTAAAVMQRSLASGEPVTQLTLPGFDGQEHRFIIERADLEPSKQAGTFAGHLAGQPGSMVTLAFKFGREAFTIVAPDSGTFLQGHPREPGEIILTSFDPDTYMPLACGEVIKTSK